MEILDYAGREEYAAIREPAMRTGNAFLVCISIVEKKTLQDADMFIRQIISVKNGEDAVLPEHVPIVLVGTKSDLQNSRQVTVSDINEITSNYQIPYIETSAKLNINVKEAFHMVSATALEKRKQSEKSSSSGTKHSICNVQ